MDKTYDPAQIETRVYDRWERQQRFAPSGSGQPYCIVIPPPNVTGTLHMGHAFQHTIMDALTRQHRMAGFNTLWQPGTDHAGIATQMVVERQLAAQGVTRHDLGREEFVKRVWGWKEESGSTISRQERRLGNSVDWTRDRFTMDPGLSHAVTEVFVRLHEEGLIYRGKRLVNWDPVLHTALSDLEVEPEETQGSLWHLRYPLADGSGHLIVATTRPETMLGDTAVAVHPDDERYRHLVGKEVRLPLTERLIPIIADAYVDPAFGTGSLKITPGHDFNDYEIGKRHNLPLINVFDENAALNETVPATYRGLDRFVARKRIVADLEALGLVEKIEPHKLQVPKGDRSGAVLEPWLTDQWYVRIAPLAEPAIKVVEEGRIRFVPESWDKTYYQWMHNIQDWCISRQLWWGHQIPAWYDRDGNCFVARTEAEALSEARAKHGRDVTLTRDGDVLDTWFSSALWPFSTLGWPEKTSELATFYPTTVLVTGFDIIFFWVARMIMFGLKFAGDVPFREVYITGLIRDENGEKMSKTKGNIIDPLDLIDGIELESLVTKRTTGMMQPQLKDKIDKNTRKQFPKGIPAFGTDALRFTLCALATMGRDIRFDLGRIEGYRNFCNKLWNAARFVLMNTEGKDCGQSGGECDYSLSDRWIRSRLALAIDTVQAHFTAYRFDLAAQALYEFAWYEYCDWYLELAKPTLQSETASEAQLRGTRQTLVTVLEAYLRLLHPMMPFITEEIWQAVASLTASKLGGPKGPTIMLEPYPKATDFNRDDAAERELAPLRATILGARQIRGQLDIPQSREIALFFQSRDATDAASLNANLGVVRSVGRISTLTIAANDAALPPSATASIDGRTLSSPLTGLINDPDAELARLAKRLASVRKELASFEGKLNNQNFVANAPKEIVDQERGRIADRKQEIEQILEQEKRVRQLKN
jgi:valyl-tRNA synthetase